MTDSGEYTSGQDAESSIERCEPRREMEKGKRMLAINAILEAVPGKEKDLEEALRDMILEVQNEKGTLVYTLHRSSTNQGKFLFYETYVDQAAIDLHVSTPHFKALQSKIKGLLQKEPLVEIYEVVDGIKR